MTSLIRNRLIWKDCRDFLPLFLAGCLAFVITIAATCFSWSGTQEFRSLGPIVKLISPLNMFVNVCGLVTGVLLFAPEKESRTSQFLGNLPVAPRSIAMSKLLLGMACVVLFVTFCYFSVGVTGMIYAKAFSGWPGLEIIGNSFVPFMCFAWGVFWSLTLRSTLFALVAATASVFVVESLANFFMPELLGLPNSSSANATVIWAMRMPVLAVLIALVIRAVPDWLQDEPVKTFPISWRRTSKAPRPDSSNESPRSITTSLVWQSFRQSWIMLVGCAVVCGVIALVGLYQISPQVFAILALVAYAIPLCAASLAFASDQQQDRYRFFQQQSEYGRTLWLARLLPSAALVVIATVCLTFGFDAISVALSSSYSSFFDHSGYYIGEYNLPFVEGVILHLTPMKVLLILLTGMSIGQFFSMLVSSPILSVVCANLYGIVGVGWAFLMMACDVSLWLFLLPAALILFLTTWVQAPRWLADKKTAFDRWYPWLSLLFAAIMVMVGFAVKRAVEVPKSSGAGVVSRDSYTANYDEIAGDDLLTMPREPADIELLEPSKELLEALAQFVKPESPADRLFDPTLYDSMYRIVERINELDSATLEKIVETNTKSIALIHGAVRPANSYFALNPHSETERRKELQTLRVLLLCEAEYWMRRDESEKVHKSAFAVLEVDLALPVKLWGHRPMCFQLFYQWSEMTGQSSERIKATIVELDRRMKQSRRQSAAMELTFRHLGFQNQLELSVSKNVLTASPQYVDPIVHRILRWMPWEFERAKRVGEHLIEYTAQRDMIIDALLANSRRYFGPNIYERTRGLNDSPFLRYQRTSPVVPWMEIGEFNHTLRGQLADVQMFRYARIRMALAAWKLDHDGYPAKLEELAPEYLDVVPCDVYAGGDFCYSPTGLDHPVVWDASDTQSVMAKYLQVGDKSKLERNLSFSERTPDFDSDDVIPANTPFLLPWSSTGGQSTAIVNLTNDDANGNFGEERKVKCYDLSDSHGVVGRVEFFEVDFELPKVGE